MRKLRTLVLAWKMWRRSGWPARRAVWVLMALGLAYLVAPADLIPDVLPVLGWLDDGLMVLALISAVRRLHPARQPARARVPRR